LTSAGEQSGMALGRLRRALSDPEPGALPITPFIGAGVASAVTDGAPWARWRGLLEHGIDCCQQLVPVPSGWAGRMRAQLVAADAISYMAVADEIRRRLERRAEGRDFASWLEDSVGSLQPARAGWELIQAIRALSPVIVTTNYDTLLEQAGPDPERHPRWNTSTWKDKNWNSATSEQNLPVVLHLHGVPANPDSVILSSADYERLGQSELEKVFAQHLFVARRFLYIGCGDGLNDPHIAPLMKKARELLPLDPKASRKESEGLEHFLLIRGRELRNFTADPLPDRVAPVAYGADFGELTDFLRSLKNGTALQVSQRPGDYEPRPDVAQAEPEPASAPHRTEGSMASAPAGISTPEPPVTLLSLEVVAQQRAEQAHAALRRAARAMDELALCTALPIGMAAWEPADQLAEHERLAASAADPAADLQTRLRQAAEAVGAAAAQAAKVTLRTQLPVPNPARLATAVANLETLSAELKGRVASTLDDITRRARISSIRYRDLLGALDEARDDADDAHRGAARMVRRLGGSREQPAAGTGEAANRAAPGPGPAATATAPVEYVGDGVTPRTAEGLVAAGSGIEQPDAMEDQPQVFPSELLRGGVSVVRVVGESMAPYIHDGDYLIVDPNGEVYDGDIAVLEKEGLGRREAIVKKVFFGENEARYESANPEYPGGTLHRDDRAKVVGKVVAVSRTIG
jgi:phage repressor protein C with HTH and peptisase S24 domain